jgi:hypothetical protein
MGTKFDKLIHRYAILTLRYAADRRIVIPRDAANRRIVIPCYVT